jgi:putative membrane protein
MNGDWGFGAIFVILIVILVILFIVWFAARGRRGGGTVNWGLSSRRDPLEIAKERYAHGEINKDQFETIKKDLG